MLLSRHSSEHSTGATGSATATITHGQSAKPPCCFIALVLHCPLYSWWLEASRSAIRLAAYRICNLSFVLTFCLMQAACSDHSAVCEAACSKLQLCCTGNKTADNHYQAAACTLYGFGSYQPSLTANPIPGCVTGLYAKIIMLTTCCCLQLPRVL